MKEQNYDKPIIELLPADKFRSCNACREKHNLKDLQVGTKYSRSCICLCEKCRDKLTELLLSE